MLGKFTILLGIKPYTVVEIEKEISWEILFELSLGICGLILEKGFVMNDNYIMMSFIMC